MLKFSVSCVAGFLLGTCAMADQIQLQFYGDVPDDFKPTIVWQSIINCQPPCRVSDWEEVKVPKTAEGIGVIVLEIPANATRLCLQEVDQAVIEDITIFMKNGRKTKVRRKDGRDIETDGSVGCHEASLRASDAKFINVTLSGK